MELLLPGKDQRSFRLTPMGSVRAGQEAGRIAGEARPFSWVQAQVPGGGRDDRQS